MSYDVALGHHLQRSLCRDLELPMSQLQPDADGDIAVVVDGVTSFVRVLTGGFARVWSVSAVDLKATVKVLREINGWNRTLTGARALLTDGGRVIIAGEILAESIEPGELGALVRVVTSCAGELGPLLNLVHGTPAPAHSREVDR